MPHICQNLDTKCTGAILFRLLFSVAVFLVMGCAQPSFWSNSANPSGIPGYQNNYGAGYPANDPYAQLPPASVPPSLPPPTLPPPPTGAFTAQAPPLSGIPNLPPPQGYSVGPQGYSRAPLFPNIVRPNWGAPGTMKQQQARAAVFDPFADNNAAPEIVGGRPREFDKPFTEAERANPSGFGLPIRF